MEMRKSQRAYITWKILLSGAAGSGKTRSALLLAKGLVGDLSKVCVIQADETNVDLYNDLGDFNVIEIANKFDADSLVRAINLAEKEGMKAIVIDSLSAFWEGKGGILDLHSEIEKKTQGADSSFRAWKDVKPYEVKYLEAIKQSSMIVIATVRCKSDYAMTTNERGKVIKQKVGLKPIQRDGIDFHFDIHWSINQHHKAKAEKDRTNIFMNMDLFLIEESTGKALLDLNEGREIKLTPEQEFNKRKKELAKINEEQKILAETMGFERNKTALAEAWKAMDLELFATLLSVEKEEIFHSKMKDLVPPDTRGNFATALNANLGG